MDKKRRRDGEGSLWLPKRVEGGGRAPPWGRDGEEERSVGALLAFERRVLDRDPLRHAIVSFACVPLFRLLLSGV